MRLNRLLPALFIPAVACGGGKETPPQPVDTPPVTPDSPQVLECPPTGLSGAIALANGDPVGVPPNGCGNNGMLPCDWYSEPMEGPNTGVTELAIAIGVQGTQDQIQFHLATPIIVDQAVPWETNGASTASYMALALYLQSQNGSTVDRVLFPTNGTITVSATNQAQNGITTGAVGATTFAEIDDTGAVVSGGCTSDITSLTFNLQQGSATFQKPTAPDAGEGKRWMKLMPASEFGKLVQH